MLRGLIKTGIACALDRTGAGKLIGRMTGAQHIPLVLGYHRVVENYSQESQSSIPAMLITREMLERHLDWVGRRFRFVSLDTLCLQLKNGAPDEPTAAVTFDDGYRDVYYNAFPLLKKKGIPAAVFVVTDLVGTSRCQIHDRLYLLLAHAFSKWRAPMQELARLLSALRIGLSRRGSFRHGFKNPFAAMALLLDSLCQAQIERVIEGLEAEVGASGNELCGLRSLTWEMVAEMRRAGITIGSHTRTHALLTNEEPPKLQDEVAGSRQKLEKMLGSAIKHFAYPDGRFDAAVVNAVAASGYSFAYTTCRYRSPNYPLLTIPRKVFWEKSCVDDVGHFDSAIMDCHVNRVFDFASTCAQDHRLPAAVSRARRDVTRPVQQYGWFEHS